MSMKLFGAALMILTALSDVAAMAGNAGVTNFTFDAPHRERLVQAIVTFPTESGGVREWTGNNIVFHGVELMRDASPANGKHPLIILSHGSGGNAAGASWLSKKLAENGYVVIAPNHQGSTSGDSRPETTIPAFWQRQQDMTALLDAVAKSPSLTRIADLNRISAVGFSLGGQTVLGLAGATMNAQAMAKACEEAKSAPSCIWLDRGNGLIKGHADLHKIDESAFNASYREPRIRAVIAIDPAFVPAFDEASLNAIPVPVGVINLGDAGTVNPLVNAAGLVRHIPDSRFAQIPDTNHFSFLPECKWIGSALIWWEGDDPVCTESGNRSRSEHHEMIADQILEMLGELETNTHSQANAQE